MDPRRVAPHFAANEAIGIGMSAVAPQGDDPAVPDGCDHAAAVRAIERTDGLLLFNLLLC